MDVGIELADRFPAIAFGEQRTKDAIPTFWIPAESLVAVLAYLKNGAPRPFQVLYDLTGIDERVRNQRDGQPPSDFTVVYHLLSYDRNEDVRLKVALTGENPAVPTVTALWPSADWYELELWDMFGITVEGREVLRRILMPPWWKGHPLRKDHPARATEMGVYPISAADEASFDEASEIRPKEWGLAALGEDSEMMYLNLGPQHPGTHGLVRAILQLRDERIVDAALDIGYHHRGAEKTGERQTWHTYIPYTDRVDYLAGTLNELPYLLAVEKLAGVQVPERAQVIRVLLCELFRIANHLVWYGTFAQDLGAISPVFYMFSDRERLFEIVEAITGGRMHPGWFRIGGVAGDLPTGWDKLVGDFLGYMPKRLREYDQLVMQSGIFKMRTRGVGEISRADAIDWGVTGPNLRACGFEWDLRKKRPYSGYDQFSFEIPTASRGDCYGRAEVRVEEIRQSLRIVEQCLQNMPAGPYKAEVAMATPPEGDRMLHDIETLIEHFLGVSWGPVVPAGEAHAAIEGAKGNNGYYLVSDGDIHSYRTRIRTPSFANLQTVPLMVRGQEIPDLIAVLGSIDFVLGDVDR
jgi:NADH-quinone oxidoreductase subunit C/D